MKKKLLISFVFAVLFIGLAGCGSNDKKNNEKKSADQKTSAFYKYVAFKSANSTSLLYNARLFGEPTEVSFGEVTYKPTIIAKFDTKTGKATSVKFYTFYLNDGNDTAVNQAIEVLNSASDDANKNFSNIKKGKVNDNVSYLVVNIDPNSYEVTQFIDAYIIKGQDIERYKLEIYYNRLAEYNNEPTHEDGENYFEESIENIRMEWSNSKIKAY